MSGSGGGGGGTHEAAANNASADTAARSSDRFPTMVNTSQGLAPIPSNRLTRKLPANQPANHCSHKGSVGLRAACRPRIQVPSGSSAGVASHRIPRIASAVRLVDVEGQSPRNARNEGADEFPAPSPQCAGHRAPGRSAPARRPAPSTSVRGTQRGCRCRRRCSAPASERSLSGLVRLVSRPRRPRFGRPRRRGRQRVPLRSRRRRRARPRGGRGGPAARRCHRRHMSGATRRASVCRPRS